MMDITVFHKGDQVELLNTIRVEGKSGVIVLQEGLIGTVVEPERNREVLVRFKKPLYPEVEVYCSVLDVMPTR